MAIIVDDIAKESHRSSGEKPIWCQNIIAALSARSVNFKVNCVQYGRIINGPHWLLAAGKMQKGARSHAKVYVWHGGSYTIGK